MKGFSLVRQRASSGMIRRIRWSVGLIMYCTVLVLIILQSIHGFLHPRRLVHINSKLPSSDPKVPLLSDNGDNYRVFFRPEAEAMDERGGGRGHSFRERRALRADARSKKTKHEKTRPFAVKIRKSKNKNNSLFKRLSAEQRAERRKQNVAKNNSQRVCRIVTLSDGKIPTSRCTPKDQISNPPHLLRKLFHSLSYDKSQGLEYMQVNKNRPPQNSTEAEERKLTSVVRSSLQDAGFQLLTRRDLDLCDALNTGYLLRLSIVPDVSELDDGIAKELYPEFYDQNGNPGPGRDLLFDGKVLVFWRGYSQEVSRGRLLLPKLDYLQASVVQRTAASLKKRLYSVEQAIVMGLNGGLRTVTAATINGARSVADRVPSKELSRALRTSLQATVNGEITTRPDPFFKFSRYGGSKIRFVGSPNTTDSLDPFMICEDKEADECDVSGLDDSMYDCLNHNDLRCSYDAKMEALGKPQLQNQQMPPMQLLQRVTMSNLVDPFTREGRKSFLGAFFAKSELVEPTYEEVVVIWRQKEDHSDLLPKRPKWTPPRLVYELADMFDIDGLPEPADPFVAKKKMPLQIRTFDSVPMANLPAVMPKTKLVFRPADAFVFDLISIVSLGLVVGSQKFNSTKLDIIALVSVSLWIVRLVIRYSNKLARYDLLVKKFLTSKISRRDSDALAYLLDEAGAQRAARASLVHTWLLQHEQHTVQRSMLLAQGMMGVNDFVKGKQVNVDMNAALNDLEAIGLIACDGDKVRVVRDRISIVKKIQRAWNSLLIPKETSGWTL